VGVKEWNDRGKFSDGSPLNEIRSHEALRHPNIAGAIGVMAPPHRALVLLWLENAVSLGEPPSFDSVVRDTPPSFNANRAPSSYGEGRVLEAACALADVRAASCRACQEGVSRILALVALACVSFFCRRFLVVCMLLGALRCVFL